MVQKYDDRIRQTGKWFESCMEAVVDICHRIRESEVILSERTQTMACPLSWQQHMTFIELCYKDKISLEKKTDNIR